MTNDERNAILELLAVACEVTGSSYSPEAKLFLLQQLEQYQAPHVAGALKRCASEVRSKMTLADIVSRLDDGRPGAEEAWALQPKHEEDAGCVTSEMAEAWGAAALLYETDEIAARMAFRESYDRLLRLARASGRKTRWMLSPGWNRASTEAAAIEGYRTGKLSRQEAGHYVSAELLDGGTAQLHGGQREKLKALAGQIGG